MLKNFLALTLKSLVFRRVRSWLTVLGIIIGIMLVVIILSLSSGIQNAITKTLRMFGSNLIVVMPGKETNPIVGFLTGDKFREKDLMDLEKIKGVEFVEPEDLATALVEFKGEKKSVLLHAVTWPETKKIIEESQGIKLEKGAWPVGDQTNEVIIGNKLASSLYKSKVKIGDKLIIKSKEMKVAGIFSEIGEQMADNILFISFPVFRNLTGRTGVRSANIKVIPTADIDLVAKEIKFQLSKQEVVRDFTVLTPEKADRLVGNVLSIVELILISIAVISLMVGAVGIMNTMYTSVLERVKYIGVMKAVGATSEGILSLFLLESGIIGLIGGISGIILGVISSYLIGLIAAGFGIHGIFSFSSLDIFGLLAVLFFTFAIGVIAGLLPARQAAKMEPAEALRYE